MPRCDERRIEARIALSGHKSQKIFRLAWHAEMRAVPCTVFETVGNEDFALHLAESYLRINQNQKALEVLDHLAADQVEPQSQFGLGIVLEQSGLPQRAIPYFELVHQRYPDAYDIAFDLVLTCVEAKEFKEAVEIGNDLIRRGHETSELDNILAEAYAGNNQIQQAVDAFRRAIALDPTDEENYLDFVALCMNQRSLQAGMTVVEVGLKAHPASDRLIFMRGRSMRWRSTRSTPIGSGARKT